MHKKNEGSADFMIVHIVGSGELPLFDFSLWDLVRLLGLDHLIQLLVSVLLEHQILLYSAGKCSFTHYCFGLNHRFMPKKKEQSIIFLV